MLKVTTINDNMRELSISEFNHEIAIAQLNDCFIEQDWIAVYSFQTWDDELEEGCTMFRHRYCYLVHPDKTASYSNSPKFDVADNEHCHVINDKDYRKTPKDGIEQLFTRREFKINSKYLYQVRINEEFIHLHRLYEKWIDSNGIEKQYIDFNDGEEIVVVDVKKDEIRIRHKYLMAFMQVTKLNLFCVLHEEQGFDTTYRKPVPFKPCVSDGNIIIENPDGELIYNCWFGIAGFERQNIFNGKKVMQYQPFHDFMKRLEPKYAEFIIKYDKLSGTNILQSCFPNGTIEDNNEVFFKKEVLEKYRYNSNAKILPLEVELLSEWSLECDNDIDNFIIVRIKDMSKIPFLEQDHWRNYNVVPQNVPHSNAYTLRSKGYWGKLKYSSIDYIFREVIEQCNIVWKDYFGWFLFNPLPEYQKESLYQIFRLYVNDYAPFAELITKIGLVTTASINVDEINKSQHLYEERDMPITKLKKYLDANNIELPKFTDYLVRLNRLRSYFTNAHPHSSSYKSKNFIKATSFIEFDADKANFMEASDILIKKGIDAFNEAIKYCLYQKEG